MYVGVLLWVAGLGLLLGSRTLAYYTVVLGIGFHLRVVLYEEPTLARLFTDDWQRYRVQVNRWWPRRTPWRG